MTERRSGNHRQCTSTLAPFGIAPHNEAAMYGGGVRGIARRSAAVAYDAPPMWTGQPGPARAALTEQDVTRRPGDAEITRYRGPTPAATAPWPDANRRTARPWSTSAPSWPRCRTRSTT